MRRACAGAAAVAAACGAARGDGACGPGTPTGDVVRGHDLSAKVVVLTGGDSGIGYETALALAGANATLVIASYDAAGSGKSAADNITRATGNPRISVQQMDLSSLHSVREGAAAVLARHAAIDVLICDAGIAEVPHGLAPVTADGFERVVQVNYIGHFLLVDLLTPALRASPGGRAVLVSSLSSFEPCVEAGDTAGCTAVARLAESARADWMPPQGRSNYGKSKFMQVYHARELAKREAAAGSRVTAYAVRPGYVLGTGMNTDPAAAKQFCTSYCKNLGGCYSPCPIPLANGGVTMAYLAAQGSLPAADAGALYLFCGPIPPPTGAEEGGGAWGAAEQARLFDLSRNWTA